MPKQIPIDLPEYVLSPNSPFRAGEGEPPRAGHIKQTNPNTEPRQIWFETQLNEIGTAVGSKQIPWNFRTIDGSVWRLDQGAVGHAMANGALVRPPDDTLLDHVELVEARISKSKYRRVWLRAFWGFSPEDEGYLGFTHEKNRERFLSLYKPGDLTLIYGADERYTRPDQRRQLLGFLDTEPVRILDTEKSSEIDRKWREENDFLDRWTFAVPVRRAWRINRRIEAKHLAPHTFDSHPAILIASRGELLTDEEAEAALALPVSPANVYGEPPLESASTERVTTLSDIFSPSRAPVPTFGDRSFSVSESVRRLHG